MAFDPDAYLAEKQEAPQSGGFDPDAYLAENAPVQAQKEPEQQYDTSLLDRFKNLSVDGFKRAAGLTARSALQGAGGMVDFVGTPLRLGMQAVGMDDPSGGGKMLADYLDLPEPETTIEKVASGATEVVTGGMGLMSLAGKASSLLNKGTTAQRTFKAMASNPGMQLSSAVGAGGAGGYAKAEGAGWEGQLAAALVGGIGAPMVISKGQSLLSGGKAVIDKIMGDPKLSAKVDFVLDSAMKSQGGTLGDLSYSIREQLRNDMKEALRSGDVSPDVVRRLVDYRTTGLTPTAGPLTLDPGIITKQKNLAAIGASSKDPKLQRLSQIDNQNNDVLIENMNRLGASTSDDAITAGQKVIAALKDKEKIAKEGISGAYKQARNSSGRSAELDPRSFTQKANDLLDDADAGGALPAAIRTKLNDFAQGKTPFTVATAEQFKKNLNRMWGKAQGEERFALGEVRNALKEAKLLDGQGEGARAAYKAASDKAALWYKKVDETPALKAIQDGVEPDKFMNTFIIGSGKAASINGVIKLKNTIKDSPEALDAIKSNVAQWLKNKALSGATDEIGNFSASAYNKALKAIGDAKLKLIFDNPADYKALKSIGRVASYEKAQPVGSAVNNSRTAAAGIAHVLDTIGRNTFLRRIPVAGDTAADSLRGISGSMEASAISKVPVMKKPPKEAVTLLPPALAPYLLSE